MLQADETGKFQDSAFLNAVVKVILTFDFSCSDQSGGLNMTHGFFFLFFDTFHKSRLYKNICEMFREMYLLLEVHKTSSQVFGLFCYHTLSEGQIGIWTTHTL